MFTSVAQANAAVIEQIRRARPHWLDVQPASSLISELNQGKTLLHAGPPMRWQEMTGPMKGACVGACLFEGWAKDEAQEQANPDMGDSAITETFGIGGAAMIAAPGVTRFVGAGGMEAARAVSEEMAEIYLERNMQLQIPSWDFQGACLGLDIRRVVETGITPLINTGIAHKEAGIGQIGAGTVRAPLACFEQALEALAESMGIG